MMPNTVARPRPFPSPGPLVVKKGSKARSWTSRFMPTPVSLTLSWTYGPGLRPGLPSANVRSTVMSFVSTLSLPPDGMASRAFTARLTRTCPICPASAITRERSGARSVTRSMSSPSVRLRSSSISVTTALMSTSFGSAASRRANASS